MRDAKNKDMWIVPDHMTVHRPIDSNLYWGRIGGSGMRICWNREELIIALREIWKDNPGSK